MNFQRKNTRAGAALVSLAFLLTASSAFAATQAAVKLRWAVRGFGIGTYAQAAQPGTHQNFAIATIGTTASTPSVMWAADQFNSKMSGTYGPFTQYGYPTVISYRSATVTDKGGALERSHAGAPTGVTTLMASAVATTWCVDPGNCAISNIGTLTTTPGAKKYGGAAKMLRNSVGQGIATTSPGTNANFIFNGVNQPGPAAKSDNYKRGYVNLQNTDPAFPVPKYSTFGFVVGATYSTGTAMARHTNGFTSTTTGTGSFALNVANQTGMISVVVPKLSFNHATCRDLFDAGGPPQTSGSPDGLCDFDGATAVAFNGTTPFTTGSSVHKVSLTFLPEPGQLALLGFGVLSLAGLTRLRRR